MRICRRALHLHLQSCVRDDFLVLLTVKRNAWPEYMICTFAKLPGCPHRLPGQKWITSVAFILGSGEITLNCYFTFVTFVNNGDIHNLCW
mmetsp:Transcript_8044/g.36591  ORF Transcript_8044/g.36591 Transcript_8044/m.36591 type:complete len:90 (-) Transcript_8044:2225-2494(-)